MVREGWDLDRHGGNVVWRGPASTMAGMGDFVVHAVVPPGGRAALGIGEREPQEKWFRAYGGQMRELDEVAILCHSERIACGWRLYGLLSRIPRTIRKETALGNNCHRDRDVN